MVKLFKKIFFESGLRKKILILFIIAASTPLLFGTLFTILYVNRSIIENSKRNIEDKLKTATLLYEKRKSEIEKHTRSAAGDNIVIINLELILYPPISSHLKNLIKTNNLSFLSVLDQNGKLLISGNNSSFPVPVDPVVEKKLLEKALNDKIVTYTGLITSHDLLRIEGITSDKSRKVHSILSLSPVYSYKNEHIGFIIAGYLLSSNINDIRDHSLVEEIRNNVDTAIIISDHEKPLVYSNGKINKISSGFPIGKLNDNKETGTDDFHSITINKESFLYKFSSISEEIGKENPLYLGVGIEEGKFYSLRNRSLLFLSLIMFIAIATSLIMSYILSKSITSPVLSMVKGTENIIRGDFNNRIPVETPDELGTLANSFNVMTEKLSRRIEMENLTADMSKRFISLPVSKTITEISKAVTKIGDLVNADNCILYILEENKKSFKKEIEWTKRAEYNSNLNKKEIPFENFPWNKSLHQAPEIIHVSSIEEIPDDAEREKEYWKAMDLKSIIIVPLFFGEQVRGFLILNFITEVDTASVEDIRIIRIITEIICSALERQKTETVLTNARNYFKNLFNAQSSILISINPRGEVIEWNSAAEQFTGITAENAVSGKIWKLVPFINNYKKRIDVVLENWEPQSVIKEKVSYNGKKYLDISFFPLAYRKNSDVVIRIDDKSELEKKDLQLIQAQKMETVGTLAGGLAHDFNNVLTVIIGSITLIQRQLNGEEYNIDNFRNYIDTIAESSYRASNLVKQLLTLSRKNEPSLKKVDLNLLIRNIANFAKNSFDKRVELSVNTYEDTAVVLADSAQIEQSLLNICVNAVHSMTTMRESEEVMGGTLSININRIFADEHFCEINRSAVPGSEYYQVQISDTGIGMDPETQLKIFDPFFTTKSEYEGTGLGLSITYNIIKEHNGFIDVYSEPGQGTRFNLYLPLVGKDNIIHKKVKTDEKLSKGTGMILIIEDEDNVRITAENILKICGYNVISAKDGIKGIEIFKTFHEKIDVVLLDMTMPKLSGKETLVRIKEIDTDAKVVMTSGFMHDELSQELSKLGVKGFIQKPYNTGELSRIIYNTIYNNNNVS